MGAAAGKAVVVQGSTAGGGAAGATAPAEDRLAAAAKVIHESSGGVDRIWDAQATCTNGRLLRAIDEIILLKEIHAFPVASSAARRRMDGVLRVAMSLLVAEFLRLMVWDASLLSGRTGLRFAVEKLSVSSVAAARSASSLAFVTGGSTTSTTLTGGSTTGTSITMEEQSLCTVDELYMSGGSQSAAPDVECLDELDMIYPASLSVLHEISLRIIRAGYTDELLHAFTNAPCDVLERFMSIFQAGYLRENDRAISFEDDEWWATEGMIRRWSLAMKLIGKALVAMKKQLHAQSSGAFDRFKNEYLVAIAKREIYRLLSYADEFTSTRSPEKLIYALEMYEALDDVAPGLTVVFVGREMELVSRQAGVVLDKLARAVSIMVAGVVTRIRAGGGAQAQSTPCGVSVVTKIRVGSGARKSTACGVGVHPLAQYTMACVESLAPHRRAFDVILAGGSESVSSFSDLIAELITCLETSLEGISALWGGAGAEGGGGLRHLFLANNTSFILKHHATDVDVKWVAQRRSLIGQHAASYVEASWAPVVARLDTAGGKAPAKMLAKFNYALGAMYHGHACLEDPDPALRAALREAVSASVLAAYSAHLLKHPKLVKSARYTAESLAGLLSNLFEG